MQADAISSHKGSKSRRQTGYFLLDGICASILIYINKRKQQNAVVFLHLQESILRFLKFCRRVNMHPGWHILIPIITIREIRYIFTEVLHGIPGVIVYDAPQETFQTLGTYQELVLFISMCYGKFHCLLF